MISGIIFVTQKRSALARSAIGYGPYETIYNRFVRWIRLGVFNKIFSELAGKAGKSSQFRIDATRLKAHRTAASLLNRACSPTYRAHEGGLNSNLHAVCDGEGQPVVLMLSEGPKSDFKGAALMLNALPPAKYFLATEAMMPTGSATLLMNALHPGRITGR